MRLRIVAGSLGGRFIEVPRGRDTRPTAERVREAWFSALGQRVRGARVLDLFAGSGALGIEALSRGAAHVTFLEADRRAHATLRRNVASLGAADRARVERRNVFSFLAERPSDATYDLALADPPYASGDARRLADAFREAPFAELLCLEHAPGALDEPEGLAWRRRYGDTELSFLRAPGRAGAG